VVLLLVVLVVVAVAVGAVQCVNSECRNVLVFHSGSARFYSQWGHQVY